MRKRGNSFFSRGHGEGLLWSFFSPSSLRSCFLSRRWEETEYKRERGRDTDTEHGYGNGNGGPRWIFFSSPSLLLFLCLVALLDGMPLSFILFYSISVLCLARKGGQKWQGGGAARVRGPSEKGELGEGRRGGKD